MPDSPSSFATKKNVVRRMLDWLVTNRRHPAMVLPVLIVFTQIIGEFYPFSHFPMYSNPSDQPSDYIYVADATRSGDGTDFIPVSMEEMFGVRAAKAKKILITRLNDYAQQRGLQRHELAPEQEAEVVHTLLAFLRGRGNAIGNADLLPTRLSLVQGTVTPELGVALHIDERLMATEP